jgi:hypothetical protein
MTLMRAPLVKSFEYLGKAEWGAGFSADQRMVELNDNLRKAMGTTSMGGVFADATPLRLENLDSTMTSVLVTADHLKLWKAFPRRPSMQPFFEWMRRNGYGSHRGSPGFREGGNPAGGQASWARGNVLVKYLGVRRGYTHQMFTTGQMGGSFVDPVAEENMNGTLQLLEMIERQILWGNKAIHDSTDAEVNYDGLYTLMAASYPSNIIDLEGQPMDFDDLENYAERLVTKSKLLNFADIRTFWKPRVLSDLAKLKVTAERKELGGDIPAGYRPGVPLLGYKTQHGYFPFEDSILLDPVEDGLPLAVAEPKSPVDAAWDPGTPVVATDVNSKLENGKTYYYWAAPFSESGESVPVACPLAGVVGAAITAVGQKVTLTLSATHGDSTNKMIGKRIYRSETNLLANAGLVATVPTATTTFTDLNQLRPGMGMGLILNLNESDMVIAQMLPLLKFPLAVVSTQIEFLLMLYHALALKAPERALIIKNIGQRL